MSTFKKIFVSDKFDGQEVGNEVVSSSGSVAVFGDTAFASLEAVAAAAVANAVIEVESGDTVTFYTADAEGGIAIASQVVYVNFNGGSDLTYDNGEYTRTVEMTAADYTAEEIASVIDALNERGAANGVVYTAEKPVSGTYSTVYAGETSSFDDLGTVKGLSETVDTGNVIADDEAFVNTANIASADELVSVIAHEVGHLMGESHPVTTGTIADYAGTITSRIVVSSGNYNLGSNNTFTCGYIAENGGALEVKSGAKAYGYHLTFASNSTGTTGGAIYSAGTITFNNGVTFTSNNTGIYGGAICGGNYTFNGNAFFQSNHAGHWGGAVQGFGTAVFNGPTTFIQNTTDINNTNGLGGALMSGGTITFNDTATFFYNQAYRGGVFYLWGTTYWTFNKTVTLTGNYAKESGGVWHRVRWTASPERLSWKIRPSFLAVRTALRRSSPAARLR